MTYPEPTCQELVELVTDYLESALPGDVAASVDRHLANCPHCVEYVRQIEATIRVSGRLREDELSPELRESLNAAFQGWRRP